MYYNYWPLCGNRYICSIALYAILNISGNIERHDSTLRVSKQFDYDNLYKLLEIRHLGDLGLPYCIGYYGNHNRWWVLSLHYLFYGKAYNYLQFLHVLLVMGKHYYD